MGKDVKEAVVA